MKNSAFGQFVLVAALVAVYWGVTYFGDGEARDFPYAEPFELPEVLPEGASSIVSLSDFAHQPLLINFWASWCRACDKEKPHLERLVRDHALQKKFIAIASQDSVGMVMRTEWGLRSDIRVLLDETGSVAQIYGVETLPHTILIDGEGRIVQRVKGPVGPGEYIQLNEKLTYLSSPQLTMR